MKKDEYRLTPISKVNSIYRSVIMTYFLDMIKKICVTMTMQYWNPVFKRFSSFFKLGGASDDFAKKAAIPYAATIELPGSGSGG